MRCAWLMFLAATSFVTRGQPQPCAQASIVVRAEPSFSPTREASLCKPLGASAYWNRVGHRLPLSDSELETALREVVLLLSKEDLRDKLRPGLVQLDGARYTLEVKAGLVDLRLSWRGEEDPANEARRSPIVRWMLAHLTAHAPRR